MDIALDMISCVLNQQWSCNYNRWKHSRRNIKTYMIRSSITKLSVPTWNIVAGRLKQFIRVLSVLFRQGRNQKYSSTFNILIQDNLFKIPVWLILGRIWMYEIKISFKDCDWNFVEDDLYKSHCIENRISH